MYYATAPFPLILILLSCFIQPQLHRAGLITVLRWDTFTSLGHMSCPHSLLLSCDRWPWTHHPATKNRLYHNLSTQMALPVSSSWFLLPEVTTILNPVLNILLLFSLYIIISPICTPKTYVTILVVFKFLEKGSICTIKITLLLYFLLIVVYVPLGAYTTVY